jgi:hypothetical protein
MARIARIVVPKVPYHIAGRGNDGQWAFLRDGVKYGVPILFGPCFAVSRIRRCAEKVKGFCERGERSDDVQREGREIVSPYPDEGEGRGLVRLRTFLKRSFP